MIRTMPQAWCPSGDAPAASPKGLKVFTFELKASVIFIPRLLFTHIIRKQFIRFAVQLPDPSWLQLLMEADLL